MLQQLHAYALQHPEFPFQLIIGISFILIAGLVFSPVVRKWYYSRQQFVSVILMIFSTLLCMVLIGLRFQLSESITFLFLVWNLFLAWIPFALALNLERFYKWSGSKIVTGFFLASWLLFFPNAPYIITDLLHLKLRHPIPLWFDLMLILSFAWTGLMLGYLSLYEVQKFFTKRFQPKIGWMISIAALVLCSFGIYLGRFLRFNSWDIVVEPLSLIKIAFLSIFSLQTLGITALLAAFLMVGYFSMFLFISEPAKSSNNRFPR